MLSVVPYRAHARTVVLDRVGELCPVAGVELRGLIDEDHGAIVDLDHACLRADFELLDGERRRSAAELFGHPPGGGAVHRARDHPPPRRPVGLCGCVQDRTLAGPGPPGEARPSRAPGEQLERPLLLSVQAPAFAKC